MGQGTRGFKNDFFMIQCRSREQSRPKPSDPPKPKKSDTPLPAKTSPVEETRAPPPGFLTHPTQPPSISSATQHSTTPLALLSSGQSYNWSSFDPYGDIAKTSETPHLVLGGGFPDTFQRPPKSDLMTSTTNPPPGFNFSRPEDTKTTETSETEWPDLTGGTVPSVNMFPLSVSEPVLGNITAAVMNANQNREPNLPSESSFPSLRSVPISSSASSDQTWQFALETVPDPPHSERSKLLKFAVAATNSSSSVSNYGGAPTPTPVPQRPLPPTTRVGFSDFSSQNFPPMTSSHVVGGGEILGGANRNESTFVSAESFTKRSKQSQLIEKVRKSLDYDKDKFTRFKTLMGWYKNNEISVEEFKAQSLVLFGSNQWREIGPEVAEMMPNIEKKNELLSSFGVRSRVAKNATATSYAKSRKRVPVSVPSVWGTGPVAPVRTSNYNTMSTARLSHEEYPTLGSAVHQPKPLPQPTPWNVVMQ